MKLGTQIGDENRFEIEQKVGSGGMGEVFRARDHRTGELAAIKVLSDGSDLRTARFAREVELLAELSHPGIVRYIAHGQTSAGSLFLAMEWLDGEDLKARLARAPLTVGESVRLATRVAEALGAAHARGIVHRDLKPSNLFLPGGRVDQVKILDFGIALRTGETQLTRTGVLVGSPGFMAPEQARSTTSSVVDARADVFALGCVLFQCLTGVPAFDGDSTASILSKILFDETPRVGDLWPEVPKDLDALVSQMLAKEPARRPSDGTQLAAALAAIMLPVHDAALAPTGRATRAPTTTSSSGERRFLSVVLLGPATGAKDADADAEVLQRASASFGGDLERLADGSTIVVLAPDRQVATDLAAQAARCALALRELANGRPVALAMGRAESSRRLRDGDVIDRAARLLAPGVIAPGVIAPEELPPIAVDDTIAGLLDARFDLVEADAGLLLRGERELARGARTLLGRATSCVGRDWELGMLTAILDECIDERGARAVLVTAAAGVGKSRLAAELVDRIPQRTEHVAIWVGRGDSLRAGSTFDLLAQALRGALGIRGGEPLAERRDRVRARVAEHVPVDERKRATEFLGELIGTPFPDDGEDGAALRMARQDAQLMSEQMRKAWLDFLQAEAAAHTVLLVLEDLHWGDIGTVRFVDAALRDRGDRPWMVLALARPEIHEVFPRLWAERQNVQELRLKELGRKAGERLVRQVLGDSVGTETIERLVSQADGNAFYLEELIRAAADGRADALPETVLAMIETRLGRLSPETRQVLRAASVFGEVCWESGVAALLEGAAGPEMVAERLGKLAEQELLVVRPDSRFPDEHELAFRHALLREGAYATLTEESRQREHRRAGHWLEQHGEQDPMALAGHFERGGEGLRAARYYLRAAEQALLVLDQDAAIARAALGLACVVAAADAPSVVASAGAPSASPQEIRFALLGICCEASGQSVQRINAVMAEAEALLREAPRGSRPWAQAMMAYTEGTMLAGRIDDLLAALGMLREAVPLPDAMGKLANSFVAAICVLDILGQLQDGSALEAQLFAVVPATGDREPVARFWRILSVGMRDAYAHEDPWNALQHCEAIRPIYDATGGGHIYVNMQVLGGLNRWCLGDHAAAEPILKQVVLADVSMGVASSLRRFVLSWLLADRGALDEARDLATQLAEYGRAHGNSLEEGRGRWALAEAYRRAGDLDGAEREVAIALGMAVPIERPGVLGTLAMLRLAQDRAADALAAAEEALAACAAMGGCGMFRGAFVRLARAEALHATGAAGAAREAIADARTRLLAVADRIPDAAHRARFLEVVPENARTLALARAWLGEVVPRT